MIEIYLPGNENYDKNGDITLTPTLCDLDSEINSVWSTEIEHPIDDLGRYTYIVENAVLKANAPNGPQLYRIGKVRKSDSGVYATAKPIFMDAKNDCFIVDYRPTNMTGQQALNTILRPNPKYTGSSNIEKRNTAYYILQNAVDAIMGTDNSFLNRWGGEILYNNHEIIINDRTGSDTDFEILYGKNIREDGIKETVDMENVVTRIVPKAYNGHILPGSTPWVDSPLINSYPTVRTKVIEYSHIRLANDVETSDVDEDIILCQTKSDLYTALRNAAINEFTTNNIDKPSISISCNLELVENSEEFESYSGLKSVSLGDSVICRHASLGISHRARVSHIKWDFITESVKSVTIGETYKAFMTRVADSVASTEIAMTRNGVVKAGQISGIIDGSIAKLVARGGVKQEPEAQALNALNALNMNSILNPESVSTETESDSLMHSDSPPEGVNTQLEKVLVFEDLDPESPTFGAMAFGTTGFKIADKRNDDDTDWLWTTFGTGKGFSADLITAGVLNAITIRGGHIELEADGTLTSLVDRSETGGFNASVGITSGFFQSELWSLAERIDNSVRSWGGTWSYGCKTPLSNTGFIINYPVSGDLDDPSQGTSAFRASAYDPNTMLPSNVLGQLELDKDGQIRVTKGSSSGIGYTGTVPANRAFTVVNGIITGLA